LRLLPSHCISIEYRADAAKVQWYCDDLELDIRNPFCSRMHSSNSHQYLGVAYMISSYLLKATVQDKNPTYFSINLGSARTSISSAFGMHNVPVHSVVARTLLEHLMLSYEANIGLDYRAAGSDWSVDIAFDVSQAFTPQVRCSIVQTRCRLINFESRHPRRAAVVHGRSRTASILPTSRMAFISS